MWRFEGGDTRRCGRGFPGQGRMNREQFWGQVGGDPEYLTSGCLCMLSPASLLEAAQKWVDPLGLLLYYLLPLSHNNAEAAPNLRVRFVQWNSHLWSLLLSWQWGVTIKILKWSNQAKISLSNCKSQFEDEKTNVWTEQNVCFCSLKILVSECYNSCANHLEISHEILEITSELFLSLNMPDEISNR